MNDQNDKKPKSTHRTPMGEAIFENICVHIAKGDTTLVACNKEGYTSVCFYDHLDTEEHKNMYRKARKKHTNAYVDKFLTELADTDTRYEDGKHICVDNAIIAKRKVQLDAMRFYLTMIDSKKYGTKKDTEVHRKLKGWKGSWKDKLTYVDTMLGKGSISPDTAKVLYELVKKEQEITEVPELMKKLDELRDNPAIQEMLRTPLPNVQTVRELETESIQS